LLETTGDSPLSLKIRGKEQTKTGGSGTQSPLKRKLGVDVDRALGGRSPGRNGRSGTTYVTTGGKGSGPTRLVKNNFLASKHNVGGVSGVVSKIEKC